MDSRHISSNHSAISRACPNHTALAPSRGRSFGLGIGWATGLAAAEALVHYHLDHGKERLVRAMGWSPRQTQFWWTLGLDQALHQASYLAIAAAFAAFA